MIATVDDGDDLTTADSAAPPPERALDRLARMSVEPPYAESPAVNPTPWLLGAATLFNVWYLRDHVRAIHDLNDGSFHAAYVRWASDRIAHGRSPFDGLFTQLGLGFPIFHHYQVLPHVLVGAVGAVSSPGVVYRWTLFLLLALWPLGLYAASRLLGLGRGAAAGAAVVSPFVIALPGYGYQQGSYTWWGYGMWTQLWGMWLFAFAVALAWRAIEQRRSLALAALVAAATITSHALTGYLLLVVVVAFALVASGPWRRRLSRGAAIIAGALLASAWLLVPAFRDRAWTRNGLPADTFWLDSYGAGRILRWLASGELFDARRLPVITVLGAVGLVVAIRRAGREPVMRALLALGVVSLVLYFGRPTLGPLADLLPARDDLYLHRMIVGVHLAGLFLAGLGLATIGRALLALIRRVAHRTPPVALAIAGAAAVVVLLVPAWSQVRRGDVDGARWMAEQRAAERGDGADFAALVRQAGQGGGRIYAGLLTGWGADYRIGYVPAAIELTNLGADGIGFTGRVPALTEPSEARFDDTNPAHYELFGVRWAVLPDTQPAPPGGRLVEARGRHRLYQLPGSGLLQVADATTPIVTDRPGIVGAVGAFLRSSMAADGEYPLLALDGLPVGNPTAPTQEETTDRPGQVDVAYDLGRDGMIGGQVTMRRPAVVVLKMSYHPRWTVTVDGERADPVLVAPGFLAVEVPAGRHDVAFRYRAISGWETLAWMALGALGLLGLVMWDRRSRRPAREQAGDQPEDQPVVSGAAVAGGAVVAGAADDGTG